MVHYIDSGTDLVSNATQTNLSVRILPITQATSAIFPDLFFADTTLFFIQSGSKQVYTSKGNIIGHHGDLFIFASGSAVTMRNRPVMNENYRAVGVQFSQDLVERVFQETHRTIPNADAQILRAGVHRPFDILERIEEVIQDTDLPDDVHIHRLLEPLVWLRSLGVSLPKRAQNTPIAKLRNVLKTDLARDWRSQDVARHFGMSEATFRRWLSMSGAGFAKVLMQTRLERGLAMLQTTDLQIVQISLDCGFKTPSHFSHAFRQRFGISPKAIRQVNK